MRHCMRLFLNGSRRLLEMRPQFSTHPRRSIALDVEHTTVGGDVQFIGALIGAALQFEEAGGAALLEVGLRKDKAGNLRLRGGEDICGDFVFWNIVVEIVTVIHIAGHDWAGLHGTGGEKCRRGCGKQEDGGFFHVRLSELDDIGTKQSLTTDCSDGHG